MANSSFEYFPGVPIHSSTDLLNWDWVGYGLHREDQVNGAINLLNVKSEDGIQAPSLRFHNGIFYIITTCVWRPPDAEEGGCTNFILTATDIRGPWSAPHIIEGAPGIDPDIFFDDDGKVWYVGTHTPHNNPNFGGEGEIWCQELDLADFKLRGDRHYLWRGACYGGVFVEGPHVYKHDGRYYLLVAEGGTGVNHAVMVASSDKITGPYVPNERNPLLTSRNLSYDNWVHSTGHADLFQLPDGRWYMALLGIRGDAGPSMDRRSNMGRESFLVPVSWEQEQVEWSPIGPAMRHLWPVAAPATGRVERILPVPLKGTKQKHSDLSFHDTFTSATLHHEWNFRRCPKPHTYSLTDRPGFLRLFASPDVIKERQACSLMGIRQRESDFTFDVRMEFPSASSMGSLRGVEAGICLFQKDDNYIKCTLLCEADGGTWVLGLTVAERGQEARCVAEARLRFGEYRGRLRFSVAADSKGYTFMYSLSDGQSMVELGQSNPDVLVSKGYTGAYLGVYCTSNGVQHEHPAFADFDWVRHNASRRTE